MPELGEAILHLSKDGLSLHQTKTRHEFNFFPGCATSKITPAGLGRFMLVSVFFATDLLVDDG